VIDRSLAAVSAMMPAACWQQLVGNSFGAFLKGCIISLAWLVGVKGSNKSVRSRRHERIAHRAEGPRHSQFGCGAQVVR
jgi:hypothetical protein